MPVGVRGSLVTSRSRGRRLARAAIPVRPATRAVAGRPSLLADLSTRLTPHEWRRRAVHMSPGLLPLLFLIVPHADPLSLLVRGVVFVLPAIMVVLALRAEKLCARRGDRGWMISVVSYAVITVSLLTLLPGQPELGSTVTTIIAFGDGSATLAGLLARGRPLPWNSSKSWVGLCAFLGCSIPIGTLIYWSVSRPAVPLEIALACVAPAVLVAAVAETLPVRLNDNIRVGLTGGLTILATHAMFVGW